MKNIFVFMCTLLVSTAVLAQGPAGRTTKTIVADVLAQMPAPDSELFDAQMKELASTGEEGVLQLADMMNPPGEGSNARIEYALSGLSRWVSAEGREAQRSVTSNAYVKALAAVSDREAKAFIIRQLELTGKDEAVEALMALLGDESLKEPAMAALASISGNALPEVVVPAGELAPEAARISALYEKITANPAKTPKLVKNALKDGDRKYRFAALEMTSPYADGTMYGQLIKSLAKAKPEVGVDILNWLSQDCDILGRRAVIAPLAGDAAIRLLNSGDAELTGAAAGLLTKTGGERAISALASLLGSNDDEIVAIAANALSSSKGDIASAVATVVPTAGDAGKTAALKLLAARKSSVNAAVVFEQLDSGSPEVKAAAYSALKDVVSADDLDKLYPLLHGASSAGQTAIQQAVIAALNRLPAIERYPTALARMNAAEPSRQYLHYPILASTGDADALAIIVECLGAEETVSQTKEAAFASLIGWNGINAAGSIMAICKNPAEASYFDRAMARYTSLVSASSLPGEERRSMLVEALDIAKTDAQKNTILRSLGATNSYPGMIKAGEYLDDKGTQQAAASSVMKIALGNPQFTGTEVRALLEKVITVLDNPDAGYEQQAIRKHLAEMSDEKPFELSDEEKREGFKVLFDGTNLDAWTGNKTDYRVQSGTISLYPSRSFGGNLYTAKEYGNFILRFEFMITPGANNGVGIRTPQGKDAAYHGMEIQILDHDDPAYRNITTHQVHGSVYGVIGAKRAVLRPDGEWNVEEIMADGDLIKVTLNGEVILDGNIREASKGGTFDGREHPGLFNKKGYIGFLGHGSQLKFRNIRIRELRQ